MEYFSGPDPSSIDEQIRRNISISDAFVAVIDDDFGTEIGYNNNYLMFEYKAALERGIPRLVFVSQQFYDKTPSELDLRLAKLHEFIIEIDSNPDREAIFKFKDENQVVSKVIPALNNCRLRDGATFVSASYSKERHPDEKKYLVLLTDAISVLMGAMERFVQIKLNSADPQEAWRIIMAFATDVEQLLKRVTDDFQAHPLIIELAEETILRLAKSIDGMTSTEGYRPSDISDLRRVVEKLYAFNLLASLNATSVISEQKQYAAFKNYWTHKEIGDTFHRLNETQIRAFPNSVRRIFFCDSIADAVEDRESWLYKTALPQASMGAQIKVCEIGSIPESERALIDDYGLYRHQSNGKDAGTYLLLAPKELNDERDLLKTRLIADLTTCNTMQKCFDRLWNEILTFPPISLVDETPLTSCREYGYKRPYDVFGNNIILRGGIFLRNNHKLQFPGNIILRKNDKNYAILFKEFLDREYKLSQNGYREIIYISDSNHTDGTFVRNLQKIGIRISAFIHDQRIAHKGMIINNVLYSGQWRSLHNFIKHINSHGNKLLIALEVDETLWAPRGLLKECRCDFGRMDPLAEARAKAIADLVIDRYFGGAEFVQNYQAKNGSLINVSALRNVIQYVYRKAGDEEWAKLVRDNEDIRAFLTIVMTFELSPLAIGCFEKLFSPEMVEDDREWELHNAFQRVAGKYSDPRELAIVAGGVLLKYKAKYQEIGLSVTELSNDISEFNLDNSSAFPPFRNAELKATIEALTSSRLDDNEKIRNSITINKSLIDFIEIMKSKNSCDVIAISDRPDESTYDIENKISILKEEMLVYGQTLHDI